ncbi:MAG: hypothetical protein IT457_19265 [Planctomycetes bacterium]|nr:hypothetical protein [Planctomycetota bacterium]
MGPQPPLPSGDPFEHFGERMDSWEMMEREGLLAAGLARDVLRGNPGTELAALVAARDSREGEMLTAQRRPGPRAETDRAIIVLMPRAAARQSLGGACEPLLEPFDQIVDAGMLPIVIVTRHGMRLMGRQLELEA